MSIEDDIKDKLFKFSREDAGNDSYNAHTRYDLLMMMYNLIYGYDKALSFISSLRAEEFEYIKGLKKLRYIYLHPGLVKVINMSWEEIIIQNIIE